MAKSAERTILFKLKVANDPQAKAGFDKLVGQAKAAQKSITDAMSGTGTGSKGGGAEAYWNNFGKAAQKAGAVATKSSDMWASAEEKNIARVASSQQKMRDKAAKAAERSADAEAKSASKAAAEAERVHSKYWASQAKLIDKNLSAHQRAQAQIRAANNAMAEGFGRTLEGAMKLGRGIALLGLVGEEDLRKIQDTILKVQGSFDIMRGGLDIYRGLSKGVEAYRTAITAATAAQKALAAAQALGGAGGLAAGGGKAAGMMAGAAAAPAATAVAGAAALAGVGAAAYSAVDGLKQVKQYGFMGGAALGSWTDKIATAEVQFMEWIGAIDLGTKSVKAAEEERRKINASREAADAGFAERIKGKAGNNADRLSLEEKKAQFQAGGMGWSDPAKREYELERQRAEIERQMRANTKDLGMTDIDGPKGRSQAAAAALEVQHALEEKLLDIGMQQAAVKREMHKEAIANLQDQLRLQEQKHAAAKSAADEANQRYKDDLAKFAALDPFEQNKLKDVRDKLAKGENLDREEADLANKFSAFSDKATESRYKEGLAEDTQGIFDESKMGVDDAYRKSGEALRDVVKTKSDIDVQVNAGDSFAKEITDAMTPLFEQIEKRLKETVKGSVDDAAAAAARANSQKENTNPSRRL